MGAGRRTGGRVFNGFFRAFARDYQIRDVQFETKILPCMRYAVVQMSLRLHTAEPARPVCRTLAHVAPDEPQRRYSPSPVGAVSPAAVRQHRVKKNRVPWLKRLDVGGLTHNTSRPTYEDDGLTRMYKDKRLTRYDNLHMPV